MIYTTYFAKLRSLSDDVILIAICAKPPAGFKGFTFKRLAPKYDAFKKYKETSNKEEFIKSYNEQVLAYLTPATIRDTLYNLIGQSQFACDIALVCYEKPTDFCHRHLVSEWFNRYGIKCRESNYVEDKEK